MMMMMIIIIVVIIIIIIIIICRIKSLVQIRKPAQIHKYTSTLVKNNYTKNERKKQTNKQKYTETIQVN
jgi:uncharacterized membrane protein